MTLSAATLIIDLHTHSYYSDGALSPSELLQKAHQCGITMMALTDHDTMAGVEEAEVMAAHYHITLIPGVEISSLCQQQEIHILGLNVKSTNTRLQEGLSHNQNLRQKRAWEIGQRLARLGFRDAYGYAWQEANKSSQGGSIGRQHFAGYLQHVKAVGDTAQAFKRYLGKGKPAYVAASWVDYKEVIQWIHDAQGYAILAHPLSYGLTNSKLHRLLTAFKAAGGDGVELASARHAPSDKAKLVNKWWEEFGFYISIGSDFHRDAPYYAQLGHVPSVPSECRPIWSLWSNNKEF